MRQFMDESPISSFGRKDAIQQISRLAFQMLYSLVLPAGQVCTSANDSPSRMAKQGRRGSQRRSASVRKRSKSRSAGEIAATMPRLRNQPGHCEC
jgi:hypothetical protein